MVDKVMLPKGWEWKRLIDVADIGAGNGAPQGDKYFDDGKYPFVRTQDVGKEKANKCLKDTTDKINELALMESTLTLWNEKTLLIPKSGASTFLNHRALLGRPAYVSSHLATVVAKEKVLPEYLFYWSLTIDAKDLTHDINYPSLRLSELESAKIPLPPLPTQKKIVAILERADSARKNATQLDDFTNELLKSVFYEMFGDPVKNERGCEIVTLNDVCSKITDGTHITPTYIEKGVPFLSVKNLTKGYLDLEDVKYISQEEHEKLTKRIKPEFGDILYTKVGVNYGMAERVNVKEKFSIFVSLALLKPNRKLIDSMFFKFLLNSKYVKRQAIKRISGIGVPDLHLNQIKQIKFPLPPLSLQQKFACIVV